jgi:hypothetical protein
MSRGRLLNRAATKGECARSRRAMPPAHPLAEAPFGSCDSTRATAIAAFRAAAGRGSPGRSSRTCGHGRPYSRHSRSLMRMVTRRRAHTVPIAARTADTHEPDTIDPSDTKANGHQESQRWPLAFVIQRESRRPRAADVVRRSSCTAYIARRVSSRTASSARPCPQIEIADSPTRPRAGRG